MKNKTPDSIQSFTELLDDFQASNVHFYLFLHYFSFYLPINSI